MPLGSVQASLLHDPQELLLAHLPVPIPVCLINHLLQETWGQHSALGFPGITAFIQNSSHSLAVLDGTVLAKAQRKYLLKSVLVGYL